MADRVAQHSPEERVGSVFASRYELEVLLGQGAMGAVYRAKHLRIGRKLAIKVLHARVSEAKVVQRFEREAELAGKLLHPNVVPVVDLNTTDDGELYLVMDYIDGTPLVDLLGEAPMPAARVIGLAKQLCDGLEHAHALGLVHRDFKPENVIVTRDSRGGEQPRIVDFGVAILREQMRAPSEDGRLTTDGMVVGTPHYMSPEQVRGEPVDGRSDLFALGIILYELLCGKLPFDGEGADVARANLMGQAPPMRYRAPAAKVDPQLEAFVAKLMEKDPALRPQSAREARELLEQLERPPPVVRPVRNFKTGRRRREATWPRWVATIAILLLLIASVERIARHRGDTRVRVVEAPARVVTVPVPVVTAPAPIVTPAPSPPPAPVPVVVPAKPARVITAPPPPQQQPAASDVTTRYREVGQLLHAHGSDVLWQRYRWIRLGDCLMTDAKRTECVRMLDAIASDAAGK